MRVCACVRACVHACVRVCVCVCVCVDKRDRTRRSSQSIEHLFLPFLDVIQTTPPVPCPLCAIPRKHTYLATQLLLKIDALPLQLCLLSVHCVQFLAEDSEAALTLLLYLHHVNG